MLLDILNIVLEADSSAVDKEVAKAEKSTDKFTDAMKKAENQSKKTGKQLDSDSQKIISWAKKAAGALGVMYSAKQLISKTFDRGLEVEALGRMSDKLNIAVDDVDAFAKSVQRLGGTKEGAQASLEGMIKAFGNTNDSMEQVLKTAEMVKGMSVADATKKLAGLGVTDQKTIDLMIKGRQEIERMIRKQKEQGAVTREQVEASKRMNASMASIRTNFSVFGDNILSKVIPVFEKVVGWIEKVVDWAADHQDAITGFFIAIAAIVTAIYLPAMLSAAAATIAATWPLLLIIAIVAAVAAAFALLYDDIMNFIDGNDSLIGQILEKYPNIKAMFELVAEAVKTLFQWFGKLWDKGMEIAKGLGPAFSGMGKIIVAAFQLVLSIIDSVLGSALKLFSAVGDGIKKVTGLFSGGEVKVSASGGGAGVQIPSALPSGLPNAKKSLAMAGNSPVNNLTSNQIRNNKGGDVVKKDTRVSVGSVNIHTKATDSAGIAKGVKGELGKQLKSLGQESSSGVDR